MRFDAASLSDVVRARFRLDAARGEVVFSVRRGGWREEQEAGRVGCVFGEVGVAACLYREGDAVEAFPAPAAKPEGEGDAIMEPPGEIEVQFWQAPRTPPTSPETQIQNHEPCMRCRPKSGFHPTSQALTPTPLRTPKRRNPSAVHHPSLLPPVEPLNPGTQTPLEPSDPGTQTPGADPNVGAGPPREAHVLFGVPFSTPSALARAHG